MSGFFHAAAQLWQAVAREGTAEAQTDQPSDAPIPTPSPDPDDLGPYPFASPAPSPPPLQLSVDGNGSPRDSARPIFESDILSAHSHARLAPQRKNNERRKLSDATRAPDPAFGYQGPPAMGKPGAGRGFQPIDNLNANAKAIVDRNNPAYGRPRHTTYGRADRNTHALAHKSIGHEQHAGQRVFAGRNPGHQTQPSHSRSLSRPPPPKRRKTEYTTTSHQQPSRIFVEIHGSEDESQPAALSTHSPSTPGARSPRSPHSMTSRQSPTKAKPASQPRSEFRDTHDALQPRRSKKPRRKNGVGVDDSRSGLPVDDSSFSAEELSRGQSVEFIDNEVESLVPTRLAAAGTTERDVHHNSTGHALSQQNSERVTSQHFALNKMRINESTAQLHDHNSSNASGEPYSMKNLRDYRAAGEGEVEVRSNPIESSEDELAQPLPNQSSTPRSLNMYRPGKGGKAAVARQGTVSNSYQLDYARTYNLDSGCEQLIMEPTANPKNFRIARRNPNGDLKTLQMLNLASVNKVWSDDTHMMRLEGPLKNDDRRYWFDLTFSASKEFKKFLETHVYREVADQFRICVAKEKMEVMFKKPLKGEDKSGTALLVCEDESTSHTHSGQSKPTKHGLVSALKERLQTDYDLARPNSKDLRKPPTTNAALARSTRSTRATAPGRDFSHEFSRIVRFSKNPGLGERWKTPLEFKLDEGFLKRRRCTVTFDDLPKLDEEEMLNDNLMNFYMLYLYDSLKVSKDQVYFFNTYFFEALTKNTKGRDAINYDAVKTWTKKDDIFSYDYIVVPINENWHWYLAIICNVSNIGRKLAIHDFEQDSQDLEKVACDVQTNKVKGRDNVTSVEHQGAISDTALTVRSPISKQPMDDGDINLFEEEKKLNLIDREDEGVDTQRRLSHEQEQSTLPQPQEELTIAALSSAQDEDISSKLPFHHHKQASKKKGRRKPLPPKKDPTKPVIIVLDSLSQPHSNATRALREWLQVEGLQRRGMSVEIDNKGYYAKATQVPMQSNLSDCGLYVLGYAQRFFRDPEDFKRKLLTGQMSVETDWPDMEPSKMRSDVRNLIFRLYGDQKEAHKSKKTARIKDSHPPPAKAETKTISPTKPQFWNVGADPKVIMRANTVEDQPSITSNAELDTAPAVAACSRTSIVSEALGDQIISKAALGLGNDDTSYVGLEPTTPPPTRSPAASSAQSKHTLQEQRGSPEVRVPVRSPHINPSSHTRYEYSSRRSQSVAQQPTGTTNPLQRSELHGRNIEELRVPISNKTPENSSERTTRARSGSHDDPITFDDSQDLDAVGPKVPNSPKDTSPDVMELERLQDINMMADRRSKATKYSSPAQRKPRQPALQHDDSLQEGVGYEWQEGRDVMRAKKLSIEDERRRRGRDATSRPQLLHRSMDAADELTGMHSGSSHTVQAIDVDGSDKDHEVAETPERQRSSPSVVEDEMDWQAGGSLPV